MSDYCDFKVFICQRFCRSNVQKKNWKPNIEIYRRTTLEDEIEIKFDSETGKVKIKCKGGSYHGKVSNSQSFIDQLFFNLEIKI